MRRLRRLHGLLCIVPLLFTAAGGIAAAESAGKTIHVTSNGWHSGIVIARADLPPGAIPETADFPQARFFEFGWGDTVYYPAPRKTFGMTLGAAFPGPAVVHMIGMPVHPREMFPTVEVVALRLSDEGFRRLVEYLHATFRRGGAARVRPSAAGLYPTSLFYPATGSFHLFNTCNTWTARGLATAGLPIQVTGIQRAGELMLQVRALAQAASPAPVR
jgi:uncharacterized protein (TIGR02117 family)